MQDAARPPQGNLRTAIQRLEIESRDQEGSRLRLASDLDHDTQRFLRPILRLSDAVRFSSYHVPP